MGVCVGGLEMLFALCYGYFFWGLNISRTD